MNEAKTQARLQKAGDLIRGKHYAEARKILKGMKHPTAKEWVRRIDTIEPPRRSQSSAWALIFLVGICCLIWSATNTRTQNLTNTERFLQRVSLISGVIDGTVNIVDTRNRGGERGLILGYNVQGLDDRGDIVQEVSGLFNTIGGAIDDSDADLDSVLIMVGVNDIAIGTMSAQVSDIVAYAQGRISFDRFSQRTTFISFVD